MSAGKTKGISIHNLFLRVYTTTHTHSVHAHRPLAYGPWRLSSDKQLCSQQAHQIFRDIQQASEGQDQA